MHKKDEEPISQVDADSMKLLIQIPAFNEESTLPATLRELPKSMAGIDAIEVVVVDDGSTDRTSEVAQKQNVHHLVRFPQNRGLARAFAAGLEEALRCGADVIVNTDADNQYRAADIERLVGPILKGEADVVIGCRDIGQIPHFSRTKKFFQRLGSYVVRRASGTDVPDTTSGFRALSREAALGVNVLSDFTYTLETLIQAGARGLRVKHVPVSINFGTRESRLFSSMRQYIGRSISTIVRIYTMYNPLRVFATIAAILVVPGLFLVGRFFYYYIDLEHVQTGHVQSLVIAAVLLVIGFQVFLFGLLADLTANNRKLIEEILVRLKRLEIDKQSQ